VPGFTQAVTSHPRQSLTNLAISTGIGMVATVATEVSKAAMPRLLNRLVAVSALICYAKDLAPSIDRTCEAFHRTWFSSKDMAQDRTVIGSSVGQFLFDTSLSAVGGVFGAKFGRNQIFHKAMLTPVAKDLSMPAWGRISRDDSLNNGLDGGSGNLSQVLQTSRKLMERLDIQVGQEARAVGSETITATEVAEGTAGFVSERAGTAPTTRYNGRVNFETLDMSPVKVSL
jgi:hypothetical protein